MTRVVEMEDMEVVEVEEEETGMTNVSYHSEEEHSKPMVVSLQEGSPPSRLASYHSEKETVSSSKSSSSSEEEESGEDDVILAEYTGTGEAIEEVGKLEKHQRRNPNIAYDCMIYFNVSQALANSPEVVKQAVVVEENMVMGNFFILNDAETIYILI